MLVLALLISVFLSSTVAAELQYENLLQGMPEGYKIGSQKRQAKMRMIEMVPNSETVENWNEMLTTHIFFGNLPVSPDAFRQRMTDMWRNACKNSGDRLIESGIENGYPFVLWSLSCPVNISTGRPENTWFKAIKGNDSFYVVQKAWKREPSQKELVEWMQYLKKVSVCDTRIPKQACPKVTR